MESLFNHYLSTAKAEFGKLEIQATWVMAHDKKNSIERGAVELHIKVTLILCHLSCSKEFFEQHGRGKEIEDYTDRYTGLLAMLNSYIEKKG